MKLHLLSVILAAFFGTKVLAAGNNQLLVLSGGGYPSSNHYSQYLQTQAMYQNLKGRLQYPVNVFFGAGNRPGTPAEFGDVHRLVKEGELSYEQYIVGAIQDNAPATKANVLNYFETKVQPELENFFLLVSDHGTPNRFAQQPVDRFSNNCIDLWNAKNQNGIIIDIGGFHETRCLSKDELKDQFAAHVPAKHKVFAMSQCFSGGFHQMSVSIFAKDGYPTADAKVCGFTAVTPDTFASGCTPNVDGPDYQGYERSFTEQLTGFDYVRQQKLREPRGSFKEAHENAILEDMTVDIPLATSDYYLWQWALKISQPDFKSRSGGDLATAKRVALKTADFGGVIKTPAFIQKRALFLKMKTAIAAQFPELAAPLALPINNLAQAVSQIKAQHDELDQQIEAMSAESDRLFKDLVFRNWTLQIMSGPLAGLTPAEQKLEQLLIQSRNDYHFETDMSPIIWAQHPEAAKRIALYTSQRYDRILNWATQNAQLAPAVTRIRELDQSMNNLANKQNMLARNHGLLRRMMIYRQGLGAWAALATLKDRVALKDLQGLLECEGTRL